MSGCIEIREARREEASLLSELALRSKAHWGYSPDFLNACRSELAVDPDRMGTDAYRCFVAVDGTGILGYYIWEPASGDDYELEALFVEPDHIGTGIGRMLIRHAIAALADIGAARLVIQGDPNATAFYLAAGARRVGSRESASIPGRQLPLFEIAIPS